MSDTETKQDPFRTTVEIAVGPNVDGHALMALEAQTLPTPPDPAVVDNPEAPELSAPTPTKE